MDSRRLIALGLLLFLQPGRGDVDFQSLKQQVYAVGSNVPVELPMAPSSSGVQGTLLRNQSLSVWTMSVMKDAETVVQTLQGLELSDPEQRSHAEVIAEAIAVAGGTLPQLYETLPLKLAGAHRSLVWEACLTMELQKSAPLPEALIQWVPEHRDLAGLYLKHLREGPLERMIAELLRLPEERRNRFLGWIGPGDYIKSPAVSLEFLSTY